jgi:hypothetical protein
MCFYLVVWAVWALTDQRYRYFLTQQLSDILAAEVRVGTSRVTVCRGLGIELGDVTVREHSAGEPIFTAEAIKIFLDVSSLLRGRFDFRHIIVTKPILPVMKT